MGKVAGVGLFGEGEKSQSDSPGLWNRSSYPTARENAAAFPFLGGLTGESMQEIPEHLLNSDGLGIYIRSEEMSFCLRV